MPIFEYKCLDCNAEFETLVMKAGQSVNCQKCSSEKLEQKLSVFSPSVKSGGVACAVKDSCPAAGSHRCSGSCGCVK